MTDQTQTFTIADPRTFDGDPFDVAARAVAQTEALADLLQQSLEVSVVMARNAEMERQMIAGGDPDPIAFEQGAHGRTFDEIIVTVSVARRKLKMLGRAAGFNPKLPLTKEQR